MIWIAGKYVELSMYQNKTQLDDLKKPWIPKSVSQWRH